MKHKLKKNLFIYLVFLLLLCMFLVNTNNYINNSNKLKKSDLETREKCNEENIDAEYVNYCESIKKTAPYKNEFFSMFYSTYSQGYGYLVFIIFLLISIPSIKVLCSFFKNNILKNFITREKYKTIIYKLLIEAYKPTMILPTLTAIAFLICYLFTGNIDYNYALQENLVSWSQSSMENVYVFVTIYIFRVFILSLIYINICVFVCKKNHNFLIATILSYIYFIAIEIFLEVVCNMLIFTTILKSGFGVIFNIMSIFSLFDYYGLIWSLLIPLIFLMISYIMIYTQYNNKEKLMIECEKNI